MSDAATPHPPGAAGGPGLPPGFVRLRMGPNPYIDACGPLFGRREGQRLVLGLRVEHRHCNPAGGCHGGMLGTLADMLLVIGASAQSEHARYMVTVNLVCDYLAPAPLGSWLEGRLDVLRTTRNLVFCQGRFTADGQAVLAMSGIAKPIGEATTGSTLAGYLGEDMGEDAAGP